MCGYSKVLFYYLLNNNYRSILELMKLLSRIVQHLNLMPPSETDVAFYLQLGDKKIEVQSGWSQAFIKLIPRLKDLPQRKNIY